MSLVGWNGPRLCVGWATGWIQSLFNISYWQGLGLMILQKKQGTQVGAELLKPMHYLPEDYFLFGVFFVCLFVGHIFIFSDPQQLILAQYSGDTDARVGTQDLTYTWMHWGTFPLYPWVCLSSSCWVTWKGLLKIRFWNKKQRCGLSLQRSLIRWLIPPKSRPALQVLCLLNQNPA